MLLQQRTLGYASVSEKEWFPILEKLDDLEDNWEYEQIMPQDYEKYKIDIQMDNNDDLLVLD